MCLYLLSHVLGGGSYKQDTQSTTATSAGSLTDRIRPPEHAGFLYDRKTDGQE